MRTENVMRVVVKMGQAVQYSVCMKIVLDPNCVQVIVAFFNVEVITASFSWNIELTFPICTVV